MKIDIRAYTEKDLPEMIELWRKALPFPRKNDWISVLGGISLQGKPTARSQ